MDTNAPLTLHDYLRVIRRWTWLVVLVAILTQFALVANSLRQHTRYSASARVLLVKGSQAPGGAPAAARSVKTQASLASSPKVAAAALAAARVTGLSPEEFLAWSSVTPNADTDILQFRVTDRHPVVANRLATAYARAYTSYRRELDTAAIARARASVRAEIAQLPLRARGRNPLYRALVRKERSLRVQEALWPDDAVLVGPTGNLKASRPQTTRDGIVGFGIGLILGIVLAFVAEALDTRVRSASEIERALGLPLLARLPRPSRQLRKDNRLVMLDDPYAEHAEAFRVLRTNLDFFNLEHGARAVMLTSAREKEGKSTTAANLAVTLARSGRHVILVDLDLRHPLIHGFFELDRAPGLMDVLVGRANLDDALVEIPLAEPDESGEPGSGWPHVEGGLRVLPAGSAARNVGELVGSRALTELLTELRDCADIVLIDGPPLLGAGDGIALSAKVDALMVIARLNELRRPIMEEVGRLLNNVHAAKLGFVATGGQFDGGYVQSRTTGPAASAGIPG